MAEDLCYRGISVSYETIRAWCTKFSAHFREVIRKRAYKPADKWHLDEMMVKINGQRFILLRAVDAKGYELDIFLQQRRDKKSAHRFLTRLLGSYPATRVIFGTCPSRDTVLCTPLGDLNLRSDRSFLRLG